MSEKSESEKGAALLNWLRGKSKFIAGNSRCNCSACLRRDEVLQEGLLIIGESDLLPVMKGRSWEGSD